MRDVAKYERLAAFGEALPTIRERVDFDLRRHGVPRMLRNLPHSGDWSSWLRPCTAPAEDDDPLYVPTEHCGAYRPRAEVAL